MLFRSTTQQNGTTIGYADRCGDVDDFEDRLLNGDVTRTSSSTSLSLLSLLALLTALLTPLTPLTPLAAEAADATEAHLTAPLTKSWKACLESWELDFQGSASFF